MSNTTRLTSLKTTHEFDDPASEVAKPIHVYITESAYKPIPTESATKPNTGEDKGEDIEEGITKYKKVKQNITQKKFLGKK